MNHKQKKRGFTLIEAMGAMTLVSIALGLAVGGFMFALKNTNESDVQSELDIDVQLAMERLKRDLRLSSLDEIFYYPAGAGPYTALSFPMAEDDDGDDLFELDADGKIIWDKTLIYHIWPGSPHQLRVTTFDNRDNTLTDVQRQEQLNSVVSVGAGTSTYNGGNASSHTIFENLLEWRLRPVQSIFDAYSPISERETVSLGYALMANGAHTFKFNVAGKNTAASGYRIGVDQLQVSPSYSQREAEAQLPATAQSGATAVSQYMGTGSWKGNHQLYFPATAAGQSFTLSMNNDRWEETNFGALGYEAEDTEINFDETLSPKDFVIQLQGNDVAWQAGEQAYSAGTSASNSVLKGTVIAVHLNGAELATNGNWIAYNGRKCRLTFQAGSTGRLRVEDVFIGKTTSLEDTVFAFDSSTSVTFSGGSSESPVMEPNQTATTDWINLEINKTNNYLVAFQIKNDVDKCYPRVWKNELTTISDCLVNGSPTNHIIGLASMAVTYPANGTYTSQIFDTRLASPIYGDISLNTSLPAGTAISTKVRSGNQPDLSDASDWSVLSASTIHPRLLSVAYKRYIQFQAQLTSSSSGLATPLLKDLTIDWTGETQLVNVSGVFSKGPDYGIVEVLVDGVPLQSALGIDLLIYKDIYTHNKQTKRVTSSLVAELRPRNTGQ
ncbi:MAG: prepilin-type N-terminal cleavage/methylation domain-containing protein [Pontiella sp.]|nr:prepilin-type N-terminal cleavage/methylation domain-containing protein [Pontiella sp.]